MRLAALLVVLVALAAVPASAVDPNSWTGPAPGEFPAGYLEALPLVKAGRFAEAIPLLKKAEAEQPAHADVLNQLGFTHRKIGDFAAARVFYDRALAIAPNHRGAREYRGELFLQTGDFAAAESELRELVRICGLDCEETRELAEAIDAARKR